MADRDRLDALPVWWARLLAASLARDLAGDPGKGGVR